MKTTQTASVEAFSFRVPVTQGAGLGATPDRDMLARYRTWGGQTP